MDPYYQTNDNHRHSTHKKALTVALGIFIFFLVLGNLALAFYELNKTYKDKIFPNVSVAHIDLNGMTYEQAKNTVLNYTDELNTQGPKISYNKQVFQPNLNEIGISFKTEEAVGRAFQLGRDKPIWERVKNFVLKDFPKQDIEIDININSSVFDSFVTKIVSQLNTEPKNATVKVEKGEWIVTPEEKGFGVDKENFKKEFASIINLKTTDKIAFEDSQINIKLEELLPSINRSDALNAKILAEKYLLSQPIELTYAENVYTADKQEILSWISFKENGKQIKPEISDEAINKFAKSIAQKIDYVQEIQTVESGTGKVVEYGKDGLKSNQEKMLTDIKNTLNLGIPNAKIVIETEIIPRKEKIINMDIDPENFTGRYIDINLTEQVLKTIENRQVIGEYVISSGKSSTPTPVGTRYIENKSENAWSSTYKLWMPYWNSIGGGYGIHELPYWPNGYREGERSLGRAVSHGCVRLAIGKAEEVYNFAPVGTPVYIHK